MLITLVQPEIEKALHAYLHRLINLAPGTEISMEFTNARTGSETGLRAQIEVLPPGTSQETPAQAPAAAPATTRSPKAVAAPASVAAVASKEPLAELGAAIMASQEEQAATPAATPAPAQAAKRVPRTPAEVREMMEAESAATVEDQSMAEENAQENAVANTQASSESVTTTEEETKEISRAPTPAAASAPPRRTLFGNLKGNGAATPPAG